jgi:hypothetical protein
MQVTPNFPLSRRRDLASVTDGLARPFLAIPREPSKWASSSTTHCRAASSVAWASACARTAKSSGASSSQRFLFLCVSLIIAVSFRILYCFRDLCLRCKPFSLI